MHRDVKPANILVTRDRRSLKLADFGLAKRFPRLSPSMDPQSPDRCDASAHSHPCFIGTPRYAAPEVLEHLKAGEMGAQNVAYTEKADIYSAALVLWYLLTGWEARCDVRSCPRARPEMRTARWRWAAMAGLVERMWDHDPEARPAAAECVEALRAMPAGGAGCVQARACAQQ